MFVPLLNYWNSTPRVTVFGGKRNVEELKQNHKRLRLLQIFLFVTDVRRKLRYLCKTSPSSLKYRHVCDLSLVLGPLDLQIVVKFFITNSSLTRFTSETENKI